MGIPAPGIGMDSAAGLAGGPAGLGCGDMLSTGTELGGADEAIGSTDAGAADGVGGVSKTGVGGLATAGSGCGGGLIGIEAPKAGAG